MAFSIGLRFYRISVKTKTEKQSSDAREESKRIDLFDFLESFVKQKTTPTVEATEQRTWFFESRESEFDRVVHGYINYGTHGFESKFKDVRTRTERYQRKATDLEEIPLYFQAWAPEGSTVALMAFQSFQGRSCVMFVRAAMISDFEKKYPNHSMVFAVITPAASFLDDAPVKTVTFLRPRTLSDKADKYLMGKRIDEVEYEVKLRAKKRGSSLSTYKDLRQRFSDEGGFVSFEGQDFGGVKADIKVGSKRRTVGVYGSGYEAGLIDVSEEVKRSRSGHPTFESIVEQVNGLMDEFANGIE